MRFDTSGAASTQDVGIGIGPVKVTFDGYDVLLAVALVALLLNQFVSSFAPYGVYAAILFVVLWVVLLIFGPKKQA